MNKRKEIGKIPRKAKDIMEKHWMKDLVHIPKHREFEFLYEMKLAQIELLEMYLPTMSQPDAARAVKTLRDIRTIKL